MVVGPAFLMCYDDRAKATIEQKIEEALAAYQARFQRAANLVLVNAGVASEVQVEHIAIERRPSVPPNNFWVGQQPAVVAPPDS